VGVAEGEFETFSVDSECRTYGAPEPSTTDDPALPGWADVWQPALRALTRLHTIVVIQRSEADKELFWTSRAERSGT
jgi:hypothetical protein